MPDLSILIAARNEMWLKRTVEDVLAHAQADTDIIVVLDGAWADPPLEDHPRVTVVYKPVAIGQRAAVNLAANLSRADYVMKLDAHCSVEDGFDAALIAADRELGRPDVTQIPAQHNLHVFNWRCTACGRETYQGPRPMRCERRMVDGKPVGSEMAVDPEPCGLAQGFERVVVWEPRRRRAKGNGAEGKGGPVRTEYWRINYDLHFDYWNDFGKRPEAKGDLVDVMSSVGACFFMRRARFLELGGLDEAAGSWGQFGQEVACKSWLSGGRHIVNKRTSFSHEFRTNQGPEWGFPYPNPPAAVEKARARARELWLGNTWPQQVYPLSWLIEKFSPVLGWHEPDKDDNPTLRLERLAQVKQAGAAFMHARVPKDTTPSAGLLYYTDNRGDQRVLSAVRDQLRSAAPDLPLVSVTLQPLDFGRNIVLPGERGYLQMFRQILAGLEALETDIVFHVEHDVLYAPSHFQFVPPRRDVFYYNQHTWRVDAHTGRALFYRCSQVSGLCAYRELLLDHYRRRVAHVEAHGFDRNQGFEPGTSRRSRQVFGGTADTWMSPEPNVDIKTAFCLTPGRWRQDQFRNQSSCQGWTESDRVLGWPGVILGRFDAWLADVIARHAPKEVAS